VGQATIRYNFAIPSSAGSVDSHVYRAEGSTGSVTKRLTRSGGHATLTVTVRGDGARVLILSVSIEYYTTTS
jgi:hypothetical protein